MIERRSYHQLVRQIAGDDRIDERGGGKGFGFAQIIDVDGCCVFFRHGLDTDIEVDGGITRENIGMVLEAGANVIVTGSAVFKGDIQDNVRYFKNYFTDYENIQRN